MGHPATSTAIRYLRHQHLAPVGRTIEEDTEVAEALVWVPEEVTGGEEVPATVQGMDGVARKAEVLPWELHLVLVLRLEHSLAREVHPQVTLATTTRCRTDRR